MKEKFCKYLSRVLRLLLTVINSAHDSCLKVQLEQAETILLSGCCKQFYTFIRLLERSIRLNKMSHLRLYGE